MDRTHALRRSAVVMLVCFATAVALGQVARPSDARAATPNRAAVVVSVNGVVHTAKITFSSGSISGLDALNLGGFAPVVRVFGGKGGAVCALAVGGTTIGCPNDGSCLTCAAPDSWAYYRAPPGATSYTFSPVGASSTSVTDGSVEAWQWGTGGPPPFVSFAQVWGSGSTTTTTRPVVPTTAGSHPPPSTTTTPSTVSSGPGSTAAKNGNGASTTTATGTGPAPTARPGVRASTSTTRPAGSGTSRSTTAPTDPRSGKRLAAAPTVARGGGGSPFGLVAFAVVLAALVGAIVFARHRRTHRPAT